MLVECTVKQKIPKCFGQLRSERTGEHLNSCSDFCGQFIALAVGPSKFSLSNEVASSFSTMNWKKKDLFNLEKPTIGYISVIITS